ncbi:MAG: amino acid permease [Zymomonas mobilis subsp. pomaceae]|uniref:Amino acid permease-associated region n=1 Tax=Zymomonas mobilis subsp. pomaceae (strain ATCC 29192 / DSM 22645 / JCM 10191 / CCUG 17912 / NBRC 13757 / NCIMB 11200 / NRRL B-4491 / Barker I) TaxID=579138 RepID=F8EW78_ZYMMT|nr:amino acid permease [Zymomonas mobilis]AEI38488.1 amino acid permease-associated region [Zymomonas mobilis subsp. pomaceae ATCC 29192]MDX5948177.1 amino acid permease [Zymomonas mobilis subsp. pomaceae]GEB89883.1 putative amino acid permease YhdG [Zymomonas mobilis subsp. pomaceae]
MIFGRVKSLDAILATAKKKSLHRSLGAFQLTMLGVGAIIGTGIFVLTAEAAQKAGPGMMVSFIIAACVCGVAAFCYAEMAAMVPVSGSAYTYSYAVMGELIAWMVGWALILEYAVAASAVSVGWSGYVVGLLEHLTGTHFSPSLIAFTKGPFNGGIINLPAAFIALVITLLLIRGTKESATVSAVLVAIKITALSLFVALAIPAMKMENFHPFAPLGFSGISAAAASIFFAYVGFDAVSTAAEETKNPQRNMPIGLVGSLAICTIFYMLVSAGVIGGVGAQPILDANGHGLATGSHQLTAACAAIHDSKVVCSNEALAWTLRKVGWTKIGNLIALAAGFALPSVILMMIFGQTRIFFVMSRDGLLPEFFAKVHSRFQTPYVVTIMTGVFVAVFSAFFPVGILADISNAGTLFAFSMVAVAVLVLRRTDPKRHRPFKTPVIYLISPLAALGCLYLFVSLPLMTLVMFFGWAFIGLIVYFCYGYRHSNIARNIADPED